MKLSKYNEYVELSDQVIIFNMISRALILISKDEFNIIRNNPKTSIIDEKTRTELEKNSILVNRNLNEEDVLLYKIKSLKWCKKE